MENDLTLVVDALPGLVWTTLADGRIDFFNQRWYQYTGLGVDEAFGAGWQAAIHPEDLPKLLECWRSPLASDEPCDMEVRLRRYDGTYRWYRFRTSPLADASGQTVTLCGVGLDIEDRRRTERALRASEDHYRAIVDGIPALVSLWTPTGELDSGNRHYLEYFGETIEELRRWGKADTFHPDDRPHAFAAIRQAVETGDPFDFEGRRRRADGVYRWFHMRGSPLRDTDGPIVLWHILHTDIDDRKRDEALFAGEKRLLEMVAAGRPMSEILEALCQLVEGTAGGCHCAVVLADPGGTRLEYGAARSLPASFIASIVGRPIDIESDPCATAMHLNERVVAADLASEPRWATDTWLPLALAHGLRACWSTPIVSTTSKILGAIAIYYDEPRAPTSLHQSLIDQFTNIASIAIERAQGDAALKLSEARKAAILDSALDCIVTIDHEGRITEFNPAAERTFGYRRDEVVGQRLADVIIPPSLREKHRLGFARYLAMGESRMIGSRIELTALRADGTEFPVELAITRIPLDGPPSFTGYLRDITQRKQAEEGLRRSEAFLAETRRLSSTGGFSKRVATGEITWSEEVYRIFELDPAIPLTLERILTRVHPDDIHSFHEILERQRRGADYEHEYRLLMPNQSVKYLHVVAHANRDQDGQVDYIAAVQDVTQRRLSEQALAKARSELAHVARVTTLGALTASIAHEVNQPLSGIVTNASTCLRMLAADPPNVDGARETARRTIRDGNRASEVVTRLRALFAKKEPTTETVNLNEATREVIALSLSELQRSQVILRQELAGDLPSVTGDRVQLQQVILNLLLNAADAMSDVHDRPRELLIRTERDQHDRVRLTVRDAGSGFEPQGVQKLFDAFYTTKRGGMGIGLSVSRSIIESHHGRLWAALNDGPGASFAFSIPRRSEGVIGAHSLGAIWTSAVTDIQQAVRNL
jgi:PAS domain S-box-containing protein